MYSCIIWLFENMVLTGELQKFIQQYHCPTEHWLILVWKLIADTYNIDNNSLMCNTTLFTWLVKHSQLTLALKQKVFCYTADSLSVAESSIT